MLASYSRLEPQPSNSPLAEGLHVMRRGKLTASSNTLFAAPFYLTWFYYISDGFNIPTTNQRFVIIFYKYREAIPVKLIYYESYSNYGLAKKREYELKNHNQEKEKLFKRLGII